MKTLRIFLSCSITALLVLHVAMCSATVKPLRVVETEIDTCEQSSMTVTFQLPSGGTETVQLSGQSVWNVFIGHTGAASDTDGNGLDQVPLKLASLNLTGTSSMGPVTMTLSATMPSTGQIEEQANNTPGILDVPPFTATGSAVYSVDAYVNVQIGVTPLHNGSPLHLQGVITHKPPAAGESLVSAGSVSLLDANGNPTGINITNSTYTCSPVEVDECQDASMTVTFQLLNGGTETVQLSGQSVWNVFIGPTGAASDTDGNGLDQVSLKLASLNLTGTSSMGPVSMTLSATMPSTGQIEEQANNTPGILDVPPFTATGSAVYSVNAYVNVQLGGTSLHNGSPLHLQGVITHKPPTPGESLVSVAAVTLFDANVEPEKGDPVYKMLEVSYTCSPVEVDECQDASLAVTLALPNGGTETVQLSGQSVWNVFIGPTGAAGDTDGNGLDQVPLKLVSLNLTGASSFGPVSMTLSATMPSTGQIEEQANNTPGTLDVPPFTVTGSAVYSVDAYVNVQIGVTPLHNGSPLHLQGIITHKPPAAGESLVSAGNVSLLDTNGNPTGIYITHSTYTCSPVEVDECQDASLAVTLALPNGGTETVQLSGQSVWNVFIGPTGAASDTDGNGLDQVPLKLVTLNLTGTSSMGPVSMTLSATMPSTGQIEEQANNTPGILDVPPFTVTGSAVYSVDAYLNVQIGVTPLHNGSPLHLQGIITHKPPAAGESLVSAGSVSLLDANGNPTGINITHGTYTCSPVEVDDCQDASLTVTLGLPNGGTETVQLSGQSVWNVFIGPTGAASDTDGNGLDQVPLKLVTLNLTGTSSMGPVSMTLSATMPSTGQIEEQANNTPGILDVPPFTVTGSAVYSVDAYVNVQIGVTPLHNGSPLHLQGVITHKPPAPGESLVSAGSVSLLDANGNRTGIFMQDVKYTCSQNTAITLASFHATPKAGKVIVEWSTASEIDNVGFNLFCAKAENGPYIKLNTSLIPAKGSSAQGASYRFVDTGVQNRKTYYYKLEDIDLNDTSTMHGPVSATPRLIYGIGK